jgi:16S rRNA (guanine527-N7)-methyltransferase
MDAPISDALLHSWHEAVQRAGVSLPVPLTSLDDAWRKFYGLLTAYNAQVNITRLATPEDFLYKLILDALVLSRWIPENAQVADVGSGGGFPALPLVIARPDIHLTAMESVGKKCFFMEAVQGLLSLEERFEVLNERSETVARQPDYRDAHDVVTARGVAALPVLLELTLPLVRPGGVFLAVKGKNYIEELAEAQGALEALQGELVGDHHMGALTPELENTVVLVFRKTAPTPVAYPRSPGTAKKNPL